MHGFINSPALAKIVALQMLDEQLEQNQRYRSGKARTGFWSRFQSRSTSPSTVTSTKAQRLSPTGKLVEDV